MTKLKFIKVLKIHPPQNDNGEDGRLIMFKKGFDNNIVPFIIEDGFKFYYYRGLLNKML